MLWRIFHVSKQVAFHLLAIAVPDPGITSIHIAYELENIMDETLVVIVSAVHFGKVIISLRKVLEVAVTGAVVALGPCVFIVEDTSEILH